MSIDWEKYKELLVKLRAYARDYEVPIVLPHQVKPPGVGIRPDLDSSPGLQVIVVDYPDILK